MSILCSFAIVACPQQKFATFRIFVHGKEQEFTSEVFGELRIQDVDSGADENKGRMSYHAYLG